MTDSPHTDRSSKPTWPDRHVWEITPLREALLFAGAVLLIWLASRITAVLLPMFVGLLLAYIADPLATWAQRRLSLPRPASAGILLGLFTLALAGVGVWLGPLLADQIGTLIERLPSYLERLGFTKDTLDWQELGERIRDRVTGSQWEPSELLATVGGVLGLTAQALYWLLIPPISFFFFVWWLPAMYEAVIGYVPASRRERTHDILGEMNGVVGGFLRGRMIISLLISALFSVAFLLAGVPYWFALGVATGLLSIVPYLSTFGWLGAIVLKYVELKSGSGDVTWIAVLLWPSLAFTVVNMFEEWVLIPWIQSREMDLSGFTILIAALIGGELAGLLGLLLAVPVTGCIKILLLRVVKPPLQRWAASR